MYLDIAGIKTYTENTKKPVWRYDEDQFKAWSGMFMSKLN